MFFSSLSVVDIITYLKLISVFFLVLFFYFFKSR